MRAADEKLMINELGPNCKKYVTTIIIMTKVFYFNSPQLKLM